MQNSVQLIFTQVYALEKPVTQLLIATLPAARTIIILDGFYTVTVTLANAVCCYKVFDDQVKDTIVIFIRRAAVYFKLTLVLRLKQVLYCLNIHNILIKKTYTGNVCLTFNI